MVSETSQADSTDLVFSLPWRFSHITTCRARTGKFPEVPKKKNLMLYQLAAGTLESTYSIASKVSSLALFFAAWPLNPLARWDEQPNNQAAGIRQGCSKVLLSNCSPKTSSNMTQIAPWQQYGKYHYRKIMHIDRYIEHILAHTGMCRSLDKSVGFSTVEPITFPRGKPNESDNLRVALHGYTQLHLLHLDGMTWPYHGHRFFLRCFSNRLCEAAMPSWTNEELSTLVATIVLANACLPW